MLKPGTVWQRVNHLSKILNLSSLKGNKDDKLNLPIIIIFVFKRKETLLEKEKMLVKTVTCLLPK